MNGGDGVLFTGSGKLTVDQSVTGGRGGDGGDAYPAMDPSIHGGGGGSGGAGIAVTAGGSLDINASITGAAGGTGGYGYIGTDGTGGAGGAGITGSNATIQIGSSGAVKGGDGGAGWITAPGGAGIVGQNLNIITAGSVAGGMSFVGPRADAIHFTGGTNTLQLQKGYSITGNVAADGTNDTLMLGGSGTATFNLIDIGDTNQYQHFDHFEKSGSSTWTLTGIGVQAWTVSGGTLAGDTLSVRGDVTNNSSLQFNQSFSGTYAGTISGSGAVSITGGGLVTFTGANSYSGGTTVTASTLDLTGTGALGTGPITVSGPGGVDFKDSTSANGATIHVNSSGWIETEQNANVDDSTIFLKDGALTLFGNTTASNAIIDATHSDLYFFQNSAAPGANITLRDGSFLDISSLASKSLSIGSLQGQDTVYLGSNNLTIGSSNSSTIFSGALKDGGIAGGAGGSLTKVGTGTLSLDGTNTYTGGTLVKAGTLIVGSDEAHASASIAGAVQIDSGATFGGHGSVGSLTVAGTVAPGNSIGTLTVNGDYTAEPGSVYVAEVDASGNHDLIKVTGHATLKGGTVDVQAANGNYASSTAYTLLTAGGGVTGRYDSVTSNLAFLTPSLSYDPDDVILTLARNNTDFATVADTANQRAAAAGLESLGLGSALYNSVVGLSAPDARNAFDATSGEIYASAQNALLKDSRYVRDAVSDRLSIGCINARSNHTDDQVCGHNIWARAYGDWGHTAGDGNAARLDHDVSGILLGLDAPVHNWRMGALLGYSHGHSSVDARSSSSSNDSYQLGAYAGTRKGQLSLNVGAAYAWHDVDSRRNINFTGFNDSTQANYNANTAQIFAEARYDVNYRNATLTPFARAAYIHLDTGSFNESGGTAALHDNGKSNDLTVSTLGVRLSSVIKPMGGTTIRAHGLAGWRHAYGSTTPEANLAFNGGQQFTVAGVPVARDALAVEAGVNLQVKRNLSVGVDYVGQFGGGVESNGIRLSLMRHF